MTVTLRLRRTDELEALIAAQQDPQSPQYHRWLTPDEFAARFAPSPADYGAVADWLERQGFTLQPKVSGTRIDFTGTVHGVEHAFDVRMNHYDDRGHTPLANENPPSLPANFADTVEFVRLSTFPLARPVLRVSTSRGTINTMAPKDIYVAYDVQVLLDQGVDGSGQTIGVVARSDFNTSDITSFQQQFGVRTHTPNKVFPTTNPGIGAQNGVCQDILNPRQRADCIQGEEAEVLLDTEWAGAMAPGATVLVDVSGADIDQSLMDIVVHHPGAKTITLSFGACERLDAADLTVFTPMYAQAAAQGQTVFVATGDDGVDDCQDGRGRSVNVLASDANVTAVGGTALDPGFSATGDATGYVSETVWNDASGASAGGASTLVSKPGYQDAPGVPTDGFRDQPDVAFLASPSSAGFIMVFEGALAIGGGTSAGTPNWAGIVTLLNQALHADGSGTLNPTLYALGREQFEASGAAVFHDVTSGYNSFDTVVGYTAGSGYDLTTGLGSPDVAMLVKAVLETTGITATPTGTQTPELLTPTPTPLTTTPTQPGTPEPLPPTPTPPTTTCVGDCNNSGNVTIDELLMMVNIAQGSGELSSCPAADPNHDGSVTIDEIVAAVTNALIGCPA